MYKKNIAIILCILMLSTNVLADQNNEMNDLESNEIVNTEIADEKIYTLTLEEAIDIALNDNPQLKVCLEKKEDTKIQLQAAKETKSQYRDLTNIPVSTFYELVYIKNGYYVHSYEKALKLADYEYKQIEAQIAYNVTQKYYNLKNCEKLVEIAQNSYNIVLDNYNNAKLTYELGLMAKVDLDSAYIGLMQADFSLQSYINNLDIAKEDFKIALNKNTENCDFVLTSNLDFEEFQTNLNEDLVVAENSRYDITALKVNYELAEEFLDITLDAVTTRKSAAKSSYYTAEYNYTNNKSLILLGIKSSYYNILSSKNNVLLANETLQAKKDAYNIAKIQYDQGLITNTELLNSMNNMYVSEVEYENSKLNYRLSVDKYKYDVQIGL